MLATLVRPDAGSARVLAAMALVIVFAFGLATAATLTALFGPLTTRLYRTRG